jgi:GntR family transcriptional regulator
MRQPVQDNGTIDRSTPVPLYFQIAGQLRQQMIAKKMREGDLLTTDERVQAEFGVSRATARNAIDELVDEGLVERVTGKGTFVSAPRLQVPPPSMLGFTEEIRRRGMRPSTRIISNTWAKANDETARALSIEKGARVFRLERVRFADEKPILHSVDILPETIGLRPDDDFSGSLYELLESRGIRLGECQNIIEASVTNRSLSKLLRVKVDFPILALRRTSYDDKGRPVIYENSACRGDQYSYAIRMVREPRTRR